MKKAIGAALTCIALVTSTFATTAPAAPRHNHRQQEQFMQNYCGRHNDNDCRDWHNHRDRWDDARYHSWYERHHRDRDFGPGDAAAALFGFAAGAAAGAITGSINGAANGSHVAACEARYRSYDRGSDTFMGTDNYRHECRL